ncbi:hypothetical protein Tco_0520991 [Tanacetum coccineum]
MTVAGTQENCRQSVSATNGDTVALCQGYWATSKECRKPKQDERLHVTQEKMMKSNKLNKVFHSKLISYATQMRELEQELEALNSFMAKIQEVLPEESSSTEQPLEQVQNNDENNVFANKRQHSEKYCRMC